MKTITLKSKTNSKGKLILNVPTDFIDQTVEVVLVVEEINESPKVKQNNLGWPDGFFENTAGACADDPITRGSQGEYEKREDFV
jgi:hypothetical protein